MNKHVLTEEQVISYLDNLTLAGKQIIDIAPKHIDPIDIVYSIEQWKTFYDTLMNIGI
jgi:hypothetical protein